MNKLFNALLIVFFSIFIFTSCKKTDTNTTPPAQAPVTPATTAVSDVVKDSVGIISKDLYLWYNQIPASFDPKTYADPAAIMVALRQYSNEPGFSGPVDKWSFGMKQTDWNNLSGGLSSTNNTSSTNGDFGMTVFFRVQGDLRVRLVERLSPAGAAGIQRSWRITKINGNTDITTGNAAFIVASLYNSTSASVTFIKPDGTSVDITLNAAHYKTQPVYLDSVYTINNKKIGYLVLNSFLGDTATMYSSFDRVFSNFSNQNVSDVIIDLRYNGGGYVTAQEQVADYLAPQSANGGLMMKEEYNDKNSAYNQSTYFHKKGNLNLSKIYFIVSNNTASASELLINNLAPYLDEKLVGPSPTDGKPVGFFPVPVGDWYVFPVSFRSSNKNGVGNYFNGFQPTNTVADGLDQDWGNLQEASLASAIKHITTGSFIREASYTEDPEIHNANKDLNKNSFNGMFRNRKLK